MSEATVTSARAAAASCSSRSRLTTLGFHCGSPSSDFGDEGEDRFVTISPRDSLCGIEYRARLRDRPCDFSFIEARLDARLSPFVGPQVGCDGALCAKCKRQSHNRHNPRSKPVQFPSHSGRSLPMRPTLSLGAAFLQLMLASAAFAQTPAGPPHNVVLFIADGLRSRMVDDSTAPTMATIAREGVDLRNSHALFPTFTTANASGMATGHQLGDTGDFSNTIYAGFPVPGAGGSSTPFLENDVVLGDIDDHFAGNYLNEATILKLARDRGYSTASI